MKTKLTSLPLLITLCLGALSSLQGQPIEITFDREIVNPFPRPSVGLMEEDKIYANPGNFADIGGVIKTEADADSNEEKVLKIETMPTWEATRGDNLILSGFVPIQLIANPGSKLRYTVRWKMENFGVVPSEHEWANKAACDIVFETHEGTVNRAGGGEPFKGNTGGQWVESTYEHTWPENATGKVAFAPGLYGATGSLTVEKITVETN